jgi:hypothetical protein
MMNRRAFFTTTLAAGCLSRARMFAADTAAAVKSAHAEIWRRFMDDHGVMIDFCAPDGFVSLPTPEECRIGKPNALGWWAPIENGAMFNGMYLEAMVNRWRVTKEDEAADKARRLMNGLLFLNSISDVPGFVGRGVSTDGRSHYPMGSNDQTFPWFYGLWRYWQSDIATPEEKARITKHLVTTADVIEKLKWQMPAEAPFGIRGGFGAFSFEGSPRLLFLCKMMHQITGEAKWDAHYREQLQARGGGGKKNPDAEKRTRLEWCEHGMRFEDGNLHSWTACNGVCAVRGLWEMETDETLRARYLTGLRVSAETALASLKIADEWDNADTSRFEHDWRVMNAMWKPQTTETEAQELAQEQLKSFNKVAPRRNRETKLVREPCFAAWVVTLAPDAALLKQRAPALEKVIATYDYTKLIYSQFFPVEMAWWRLQLGR